MGSPPSLPHGANGFEFDDFAIEFRADKVILFRKSSGDHYTFHLGNQSGVLDVHRTWKDETGVERHQTVFAMRHEDIPALLGDLSFLTVGFFRVIRRLRVGWLYRNKIGIVYGLDPITDDQIARVTRRKARRKRLVVDEEKLQDAMQIPEYLDDIWDLPDGAFSLVKGQRRIGIGFKATDPSGTARLYWFKVRDVARFSNDVGAVVSQAVMRYAIPPDKYGHYGVLSA
jgi:hypothetical protein